MSTTLRIILLLFLQTLPALGQGRLTYSVEYSSSQSQRIHVTITLAKPIRAPLTLIIPRAIPSGYAQQMYDRYVEFAHYTVYIEILKPVSNRHSYGFSMEHLDSSTYFLGTDAAMTKATSAQQLRRDRFNFAHHFSHSWIPKKVFGPGYLPFTWELAPLIDTIWFNEGFARYAAIEALADALPEEEGKAYRQRQIEFLRETLASMPPLIRDMPLLKLSELGSFMYSEDFRIGRTLFSKGALIGQSWTNESVNKPAEKNDCEIPFVRSLSGAKDRAALLRSRNCRN